MRTDLKFHNLDLSVLYNEVVTDEPQPFPELEIYGVWMEKDGDEVCMDDLFDADKTGTMWDLLAEALEDRLIEISKEHQEPDYDY